MTRYAPLWNQALAYPAQTDRALIAALWPQGGPLVGAGVSADGVSMTLTIRGPGSAVVPLPAPNGAALCMWDANTTVVVGAPPVSGQSRIDLVYAQVRDHLVGGGTNNDFIFGVIAGTPVTSGPVPPALPANSCHIAQVTVTGAQAYLTQAQVSTPWLGGTLGTPTGTPAIPSGQTLSVAQDGAGDWWVYKVAVGTWARARNALHCRVYQTAGFSWGGSTLMGYDTVTRDPYGMYQAGSGLFTAPVPGVYQLASKLAVTPAAGGNLLSSQVTYKGIVYYIGGFVTQGAAATHVSLSPWVHYMAAGDQVEQIVSLAGGGTAIVGTTQTYATFDYLGTG